MVDNKLVTSHQIWVNFHIVFVLALTRSPLKVEGPERKQSTAEVDLRSASQSLSVSSFIHKIQVTWLYNNTFQSSTSLRRSMHLYVFTVGRDRSICSPWWSQTISRGSIGNWTQATLGGSELLILNQSGLPSTTLPIKLGLIIFSVYMFCSS